MISTRLMKNNSWDRFVPLKVGIYHGCSQMTEIICIGKFNFSDDKLINTLYITLYITYIFCCYSFYESTYSITSIQALHY